MTTHLLSSSSIEGTGVINGQGEDLGHIRDLMIAPEGKGEIEYAVLSFGGFLGLGDKLFAVPFDRLTVDREHEKFVLNVDKERLKDAPGFDKDNWPDFASNEFRTSIRSWYG